MNYDITEIERLLTQINDEAEPVCEPCDDRYILIRVRSVADDHGTEEITYAVSDRTPTSTVLGALAICTNIAAGAE